MTTFGYDRPLHLGAIDVAARCRVQRDRLALRRALGLHALAHGREQGQNHHRHNPRFDNGCG